MSRVDGTPPSPISGSANVELEEEFVTARIVDGYRAAFGIDVSRFFGSVPRVQVYRCRDSGYRFFHPFTVAADAEFYAELQMRLPWCYGKLPEVIGEWRQEHEAALAVIPRGAAILEIGSGTGGFVARLCSEGWDARGLELNPDAVRAAGELGRPVLGESISAHADTGARYDVVCAFQTLEHVPSPVEFVRQARELLRPAGRLIVTVPNNGSYLRWVERDWLNYPPHHMGLWDSASLERAAPWFGLEVESVAAQPLQPEHVRGWVGTLESLAARRSRVRTRLVFHTARSLLESAVEALAPSIDGHTVMGVYAAPRADLNTREARTSPAAR